MSIDSGKKVVQHGINASHIESRSALAPINLRKLTGAGTGFLVNSTLWTTTTAGVADNDTHLHARNDGTNVYISGSLRLVDNATLAVNTWATLFTLTTASGASGLSAEARLLKPATAIIDVDAKQEVIDAGTAGSGLTAGKTLICGSAFSAVGAVVVGAGTAGAAGVVRIRCSAANTYIFEVILSAALTDPGTVTESLVFSICYPAEPRDAIALA